MTARTSPALSGVLTDLGYLLMGSRPRLHRLYRWWGRRRYARLAPGYGEQVRDDPTYLAALQALLLRLPSSPQRIVEIGAGTGAATSVLTGAFPAAAVIAVDLSAAMLARLRLAVRVRPVVGDAVALPLGSGTADLLVAHNAPFHLDEMRRVAAPGAVIAIVLSSAAGIPTGLRRALVRALITPEWPRVEEYRARGGVALLFRRAPAAAAAAR